MSKILLVDDDADVRRMGKRILEKEGHVVVAVDNGLTALDELNKNSYDLLVSDAAMPQYSGFDLIRAIRRQGRHQNLPIAMLTGRREKQDIQQAIELGVKEYIVKPIDPTVLLAKVNNLIGWAPKVITSSAPVRTFLEARLEIQMQITKIGLVGFKAISGVPLNAGMQLHVNVGEFNCEHLPLARILHCTIDPENENQYFLQAEFIEIHDDLKNEISLYVQHHLEVA